MVTVVENWSDIEGTVLSVAAEGRFVKVDVDVERVDDVDGQPNLLARMTHRRLAIRVPLEAARSAAVRPGEHLAARVRRAGPAAVYAHPDMLRVNGPASVQNGSGQAG